uniref:Uncharacterized protein n=1 Tax=Lotharella globosa TaxID=91324 RepID=A0A7S4DFC3_9EUKA
MNSATSSQEKSEDSSSNKRTISIEYNMALLNERDCNFEDAESSYRRIVSKFPYYVDAHLRLGCLAKAAGNYDAAESYIRTALKHDENNRDARSLLGNLYSQIDLLKSQKCFREIIEIDPEDAYANLALADLHHKMSQKADDVKEKKQHLERAQVIYHRILSQKQPNNLYAANGLGVAFIFFNRPREAKETFVQVRDADKTVGAVWVNLGHAFVSLRQFPNAIAAYTHALENFPEFDRLELLEYIARAHYEADDLDRCKRALVKALHMAPAKQELWFNLAISLEHSALKAINNVDVNRTYKQVKRAVDDFKQARDIFSQVATQCGVSNDPKDLGLAKRGKSHYEACDDWIKSSELHLRHEEEHERIRKEEREVALRQAEKFHREQAEARRNEQLQIEEERRRKQEQLKLEIKRLEEAAVEAEAAVESEANDGANMQEAKESSNSQNEKKEDSTKPPEVQQDDEGEVGIDNGSKTATENAVNSDLGESIMDIEQSNGKPQTLDAPEITQHDPEDTKKDDGSEEEADILSVEKDSNVKAAESQPGEKRSLEEDNHADDKEISKRRRLDSSQSDTKSTSFEEEAA